MVVQLFSEEGHQETEVKTRKRPFMTAVVIIKHLYNFFPFAHLPSFKLELTFISKKQFLLSFNEQYWSWWIYLL